MLLKEKQIKYTDTVSSPMKFTKIQQTTFTILQVKVKIVSGK